MGSRIARQTMEDFRQLFDMFDEDDDQHIHSTQFAQIITLIHDEPPSDEQLQRFIRIACQTPSNEHPPQTINFSQFMTFFALCQQDWDIDISDSDIFRILDQHGHGIISPADLLKVLNRFGMNLSEEEANAMADFATPLPGPNDITPADISQVILHVRKLRESHQTSCKEAEESSSTS